MKTPTKLMLMGASAVGLVLIGYFQGYLHGILKGHIPGGHSGFKEINAMQKHLQLLRGGVAKHSGNLNVTVKERPFGMHVRRGSVVVEEVFPGFPAEKLGIHSGCTITEIAGEPVQQGTWLKRFQKLPTPFELFLFCNTIGKLGHGPLSADPHKFRTMVAKKPYGMNIQVNKVPRVIEVLPGSAAEAAGVKHGFVLTHVNEQSVDSETWFDAWNNVKPPATLTFDTTIPVSKDNPFFDHGKGEWLSHTEIQKGVANLPEEWHDDHPIPGFEDVVITVKELPFGMHVYAVPGQLPIVKKLSPGLPAEKLGVRPGDVLHKVAGHHVDSSTWFAAFQHAVPPFGLRFRRPDSAAHAAGDESKLMNPIMPTVGDLVVKVEARPFGMQIKQGTHTVKDVFPGFPAHKAGIREGCEILQIGGKNVSQGTWMDMFQKEIIPFSLKLFCPKKLVTRKKTAESGHGPLLADEHNFRVKVAKRPFGMNLQTHNRPRVLEVLPGYPAEAAGVKAGFVLIKINDQAVDAENWFDLWQKAPVGTELTFDTNAPVHPDNPHFKQEAAKALHPPTLDEEGAIKIPLDLVKGYSDFRAAVKKLPFGAHMTTRHGRPTVESATKGMPAEAAGIKAGDVLIGISGLPVDASSWFASFSQASPPFGLRFRRPLLAAPAKQLAAPAKSKKPLLQGSAAKKKAAPKASEASAKSK